MKNSSSSCLYLFSADFIISESFIFNKKSKRPKLLLLNRLKGNELVVDHFLSKIKYSCIVNRNNAAIRSLFNMNSNTLALVKISPSEVVSNCFFVQIQFFCNLSHTTGR